MKYLVLGNTYPSSWINIIRPTGHTLEGQPEWVSHVTDVCRQAFIPETF